MPSRYVRLFVFATLLTSAQAQTNWISLKAPNFQMYTTRDAKSAAQDLAYLESVRTFFADAKPFGPVENRSPVRIIAFQTKSEYAPYAFRSVGGAYYTRSATSDYLVFGDASEGNHALAAHELTHVEVTNAGLKLPIWLNEGMAELYSTLAFTQDQAWLGRVPDRHLETVRHQKGIPWDVLFSVDLNSPQYNESDKVSLFYAQSWAATHMLAISPGYSAHFVKFIEAVSGGQTTADALLVAYQKTLPQFNDDLRAYLQQRTLPDVSIPFTARHASAALAVSEPSDFDIGYALADVLASKPATLSEGETKLSALAQRYPERPEPEEALGVLALHQVHKEEARRHLALAVERHSKDAEVFYQYAALEQDAGASNTKLEPLFQRALDLAPGMDKARMELGFLAYQASDYESALARLSQVKTATPGSEYEFNFVLAQSFVNVNRFAEGAPYAEKAKKSAATPEEKQRAEELAADIAEDQAAEAKSVSATQPKVR